MSEQELEQAIDSNKLKEIVISFYDAQIKNTKKLEDMDKKLEPIYAIYDTTIKFGIVAKFIAKFIITPMIIFIGALLTIKNLIK